MMQETNTIKLIILSKDFNTTNISQGFEDFLMTFINSRIIRL